MTANIRVAHAGALVTGATPAAAISAAVTVTSSLPLGYSATITAPVRVASPGLTPTIRVAHAWPLLTAPQPAAAIQAAVSVVGALSGVASGAVIRVAYAGALAAVQDTAYWSGTAWVDGTASAFIQAPVSVTAPRIHPTAGRQHHLPGQGRRRPSSYGQPRHHHRRYRSSQTRYRASPSTPARTPSPWRPDRAANHPHQHRRCRLRVRPHHRDHAGKDISCLHASGSASDHAERPRRRGWRPPLVESAEPESIMCGSSYLVGTRAARAVAAGRLPPVGSHRRHPRDRVGHECPTSSPSPD
jgi:hypothetical protein